MLFIYSINMKLLQYGLISNYSRLILAFLKSNKRDIFMLLYLIKKLLKSYFFIKFNPVSIWMKHFINKNPINYVVD